MSKLRKFVAVRCCRCREKTTRKLFQIANGRVCEPCKKLPSIQDLKDIGWKARRVR